MRLAVQKIYNEAMEGTMLLDSSAARVERPLPVVFLDTSVISGYLRGEPSAVRLFSAESRSGVRFAVNSIVLQELILTSDAETADDLYRIFETLEVLPINLRSAESLVPKWRALDGLSAHVNDLLILSSAESCEYFVTDDARRREVVVAFGGARAMVTPQEFVSLLQAA